MTKLHIKLTLNYDETQDAADAVCSAVQNILENHEHVVTQCEVVEVCPQCDSDLVEVHHHTATFAVPECNYRQCVACGHQWGHS